MAVMGKKVWAVVCGVMRMEFELYSTLAMLCEYRSKGLIDGIVISTWKGEADRIPTLREKMAALNIDIIESAPLKDEDIKNANPSFFRQIYQLKKGLEHIPNDVFVLKCRTDFSETLLRDFKDVLSGKVDLTLGHHGAMDIGMCYRIAVGLISVTTPFFFDDKAFLGYSADINRMINIKMTVIEYGFTFRVDNWFFAGIFTKHILFFEQLFLSMKSYSFLDREIFHSKLKQYLNDDVKRRETFAFPVVFNKFFALYFVLIRCCFQSVYYYNQKIDSFYLADVFACDSKIGMSGMRVKNEEVLRMIMELECKPTYGYIELYKEIQRLASYGYSKQLYFTKQEYDEMCKWVKDVLGEEPSKWFIWRENAKPQKNSSGFAETADILFSNYNAKALNGFNEMMYNICFEKGTDFYASVQKHLDDIKRADKTLYEAALGAASRSESPSVLKMLAKGLYNKTITNEYSDFTYIFERWANHPTWFWTFPIVPDMLSAFYYYGKYAEPLGKTTLSKNFYNQLLRKFNLSERSEPQSFADGVLDLIKEIVSIHYTEYKENLSVKYMIDFLVDEFSSDIFSEKTRELICGYAVERRYGLPFQTGEDDAFGKLLAGAACVNMPCEAEMLCKLIIREKYGQSPSLQIAADDTVRALLEKGLIKKTCLIDANFSSENQVVVLNPSEVRENSDFILLLRTLASNHCLGANEFQILNLCAGNAFKRAAYELLIETENEPIIEFFSMKNGCEMWVNYKDFSSSGYNKELPLIKNKDGLSWSYSDKCSPSAFAALLKVKDNKIFISVELSTKKCRAKGKLLKLLCEKLSAAFDVNADIIRLKVVEFPFESEEQIGSAVRKALDEFLSVGKTIVGCASGTIDCSESNANDE